MGFAKAEAPDSSAAPHKDGGTKPRLRQYGRPGVGGGARGVRGGSDAAGNPAWLLAGGQYGAEASGLRVGRCGGLLAWDVGWPWGCC